MKSGFFSKRIQVRADRLNVTVVPGLNEHADDADTRNLEVVGSRPSMLLIHDQKRRIGFDGQCDCLRLTPIQILSEGPHEVPVRNSLRLDPRRVPDRFCPRLLLGINDNLISHRVRKRDRAVDGR